MFRVIKLKSLILGIVVAVMVVILSVGAVSVGGKAKSPPYIYTVVLDAGHGGRDNGCTGATGSKESDINLAIVKKLKSCLESLNIRVELTRCDGNGLYDAGVDNYKLSDLNNRLKIIEKASADMVISIHQNSFSDSSQCGAQVFYQKDDEKSQAFAQNVHDQLTRNLNNARQEIIHGDYYLLKESGVPAIIVECGYLTNLEEEKLLQGEDYQYKVAYTIMCGVVSFLGMCGND